MRFKIFSLLTEEIKQTKLSGEIEAGYEQFERDFKKEMKKSVDNATIQEIKNSKSWKKFISSLRD